MEEPRAPQEHGAVQDGRIVDATTLIPAYSAAASLVEDLMQSDGSPMASLSPAEQRVLYHLMMGKSPQDIASVQIVSMPTAIPVKIASPSQP